MKWGWSHIGDVLAIPFFLALFVYFYKIEDKTPTEYCLMLFALSGLVLDIVFTLLYLNR